MSENWQVIGRGKNGWYANRRGCSGSGGTLNVYIKEAAEGALVYDADGADMEAYMNHVLHGPMLSLNLEPEQSDRFSKKDRETASFMLPGLSGGYETIAAKAITDESWGGLDSVGIGIFEQLLRKVPGMKFGRVVNNEIVWEE